jgi:hypothetical protein
LKSESAHLIIFYPNKNSILFQGDVYGTTFTGDPGKTTLGNTVRSWVINDLIKHKLNKEAQRHVFTNASTGDDI